MLPICSIRLRLRSATGQFWLKGRGKECGTAAFLPSPYSLNLSSVPERWLVSSVGELVESCRRERFPTSILAGALKRIHIKKISRTGKAQETDGQKSDFKFPMDGGSIIIIVFEEEDSLKNKSYQIDYRGNSSISSKEKMMDYASVIQLLKN